MKIGMMQPYLFPYIGYFQLMALVDVYVIVDEVKYISKGFMNRNVLLPAPGQKEPRRFTFSVQKDSHDKMIKERFFSEKIVEDRKKLLYYLNTVYRKAPYFQQTMEILNDILFYDDRNMSKYLGNSLMKLAEYLGIKSRIYILSEIPDACIHTEFHDKNDRIFTIARYFGADHYINSIGGQKLYRKEVFEANALRLDFIRRGEISYKQFSEPFVEDLSIIDVMMFNRIEEIRELLQRYELVEER